MSSEPIKAKRGRKSKKELMAALNIEKLISPNKKESNIDLNISEINNNEIENNTSHNDKIDSSSVENLKNEDVSNIIISTSVNETNHEKINEDPPIAKKRGRKPKGGKIIQHIISNEKQTEDKPNVILHLKCSMKDLQNVNQGNCLVETFNFKNDLPFDLLTNNDNIKNDNKNYNEISSIENENDNDETTYCKDVNKDIWKKLKQLEHNLHINNLNNKRSACFWDTHEFDNPPIYIPKHFINGSYQVYGCFCSPECGVAYLMNESIDSSSKFERYHLFNHIYSKIYDYKKNIKPAPNPYYMLEKYYGNLSIQEYRSLLRNERLFLIVDKPLTKVLPELHEDNDDFILNNKFIPSNYNVKSKVQRKMPNKNNILNEKFGVNQSINE
jgi:hypothetical protein